MKENQLTDPVGEPRKVAVKGGNVSFYASTKVLDTKTHLFAKYGHGSFSKYIAKALAEKKERDGGIILDMEEL